MPEARNIFTYGTLMVASVMHSITSRHFANTSAEIENYARFRVTQTIYPGLKKQSGCVTRGTLYFHLDIQSLQFLDLFEGASYCRRPVTAITTGGEKYHADVYLTAPEYYHLLEPDEWDPEVFKTEHLENYLRHCGKFHERHKQQSRSVV